MRRGLANGHLQSYETNDVFNKVLLQSVCDVLNLSHGELVGEGRV